MSYRNRIEAAAGVILPILLTACGAGGAGLPGANGAQATETVPAPTGTHLPLTTESTRSDPLPPPLIESATVTPRSEPEKINMTEAEIYAIMSSLSEQLGINTIDENSVSTTIYPRVEKHIVGTDPSEFTVQPNESVLIPFELFPYYDPANPIPGVGITMNNSTSPVPPSTMPCEILFQSSGLVAVNKESSEYHVYLDPDISRGSIPMGPMTAQFLPEHEGMPTFGFAQIFNPFLASCKIILSVHPLENTEGQQAYVLQNYDTKY